LNPKLLEEQLHHFSGKIEELDIGDKKLYFIADDVGDERAEYLRLIGKDRLNAITDSMIRDNRFRDFMLVNLQNIFRYLRKSNIGPRNFKYSCIIDKQEGEGIYEVTTPDYIGFIDGDVEESVLEWSNPQMIDFIRDFGIQFQRDISILRYGNQYQTDRISIKKDIIDQVEKLTGVCGFSSDKIFLSDRVALIRDSFQNEKSRTFLSAWQLNIFFEQFIAKFIETNTTAKCITNKNICILPTKKTVKDEEYTNGYLELDVIGYDEKESELFVIECKNGNIGESEVSKFLGRTRLIESTYDIVIDKKIIIGTRYLDRFFTPIKPGISILDIHWFDQKDYNTKCYKEFKNYLKN